MVIAARRTPRPRFPREPTFAGRFASSGTQSERRVLIGTPLVKSGECCRGWRRLAQSADEALVVDQTIAEVTDDNAVSVATDTTSDSLLVHDVVTNPRPVNDLAVEAGAFVEYPAEVRT
jgi:hypothetical protein